ALRLRPDIIQAWNGLGVAQTQRRRPKDALNSFTTALQKQPNYPPALLNVAILHQQYLNNRPLALQKYQDYLELDPAPREAATVQEIVRQLRVELTPPARREPTNSLSLLPTSPLPNPPTVGMPPHLAANSNVQRTLVNPSPTTVPL